MRSLLYLSATLAIAKNSYAQVITPDIEAWLGQALEKSLVAGLVAGVVRPNASTSTEFTSWGKWNEDGGVVAPDVGLKL
jgi:hypothetical protein